MPLRLNWYQRILCNILKQGKIPKHMAFIMDGNRRYAQNLGQQKLKGHQYGVEALERCLLICSGLNIKIVSLYCFSLENFKRSEIEVNKLMQLVMSAFSQYSKLSQMFIEQNIRVCLVGDCSRIKLQVLEVLKNIEEKTKTHTKMQINLCFAYDSIYQTQNSLQQMKKKQQVGFESFWDHLLIKQYIDVLVRTSNQHRLSNFLLVQSAYCQISFLKQNWPEINMFSFVKILLDYNYNYDSIQEMKNQILRRHKQANRSQLKQQ